MQKYTKDIIDTGQITYNNIDQSKKINNQYPYYLNWSTKQEADM